MNKIISAMIVAGAMSQMANAMPMGDLTHRHFYKEQEWIWQKSPGQQKAPGVPAMTKPEPIQIWLAPLASTLPLRPPVAPTVPFRPSVASTLPLRPPVASTLPLRPPVASTLPLRPPVASTLPLRPPVASTLSLLPELASTLPLRPPGA